MSLPPINLKTIRQHKRIVAAIIILILVIVFFILILSGRQNCEITKIKGGVIQSCKCIGLEVTVKSTTNSGEQKTICVGHISSSAKYK